MVIRFKMFYIIYLYIYSLKKKKIERLNVWFYSLLIQNKKIYIGQIILLFNIIIILYNVKSLFFKKY